MLKVRMRRTGVYLVSSLINTIRLLNDLMFILSWFKPRCMVREEVFFREDFYHYVVHYYEGYDELWAQALYHGGHQHVFLGRVRNGFWIKPKNYHLLKWNMQGGLYGDKGAPKLFRLYRENSPRKRGVKKQRKKIYTMDDFKRWGSQGGSKRWHGKKRLSTAKVLRDREGGIE